MHAFILLDKAKDITSNKALQQVKKILQIRKAGHTGSLDPIATGMLPIALGEATKFCQYLLNADKTYQVTAKLGVSTDTYDSEGNIISSKPVPNLNHTKLEEVLKHFRGQLRQHAPPYSALKYQGKPLYYWAKRGIQVPTKIRDVEIFALEQLALRRDEITLQVKCSKGTYIRSLIHDIGNYLGCGAHVIALRRIAITNLNTNMMLTLEQLIEKMDKNQTIPHIAMEDIFYDLPQIKLDSIQTRYIKQGQKLNMPQLQPSAIATLYNQHDQFIGLGEFISTDCLKAKKLLGLEDREQRTE